VRKLVTFLCGVAFLASAAMALFLPFAPLYQYEEITLTESGRETVQGTATLLEVNGSRVLIQLVAVSMISGLPLLAALRRSARQRILTWLAALLLLAYSIAGGLTIGLAFMPSAILLLVAAMVTLFIRKSHDQPVAGETGSGLPTP
jgi:hypothetical protein